jgi:hypothetical protein
MSRRRSSKGNESKEDAGVLELAERFIVFKYEEGHWDCAG